MIIKNIIPKLVNGNEKHKNTFIKTQKAKKWQPKIAFIKLQSKHFPLKNVNQTIIIIKNWQSKIKNIHQI